MVGRAFAAGFFSLLVGNAAVAEANRPSAVCDVPGPKALSSAELAKRLAEREQELEALKHALAGTEPRLYAEAVALGVVDAVRASGLPHPQQRRLAVAIVREAKRQEVDPLLVVAVIRTESSFDNYAVSPVGAMGLMQVMPATGAWLLERRGEKLRRRTNLFDPELNVALGTFYLAELIAKFGAVDKALVAYNAGPSNARKILARPEARKKFMAGYPAKVLREHRKLREAHEELVRRTVDVSAPDARG
jgi:soluble lytic murein transglycosylase